ncbi:hypothetical protein, conserved [Plasmodium gonderi]|uniref:CS domain-containing protein n=1 Tax=Plasmodium gonderi TaxID=77519 RepID=A0A1Y1JK04_PLAGO|nr:hypothetical protein, conserved [Plasmodium gonderi]GAW82600.1 hypothetical protein, conserved [Plasmodium gonderi]
MSSIINYSKFDNIDVSSSDDESKNKKPQITTLGKNDKVLLGPRGLSILKNENEQTQDKDAGKSTNQEQNEPPICSKQFEDVEKNIIKRDNNNENLKNKSNLKNMIINGGVVPYKYLWNQSAQDINAYITLPLHSKAKSLVVQIDEDKLVVKKITKLETFEQNKHKQSGNGTHNNWELLIDKPFPFKINTNEDTQLWEIQNLKINWNNIFHLSNEVNNQNLHFDFGNQLIDKEETFLYISLKKKNEIENSYIWWSCLFKNDETINVSKLPTRNSINRTNNSSTSFKNIWEEAHLIFKKNIAKRELPRRIDS